MISSKHVKELTPAISFEPYGPKEAKRSEANRVRLEAREGEARATADARSKLLLDRVGRETGGLSVWFPIAISLLGVVLKQGSPQDGGVSSVVFGYLFV